MAMIESEALKMAEPKKRPAAGPWERYAAREAPRQARHGPWERYAASSAPRQPQASTDAAAFADGRQEPAATPAQPQPDRAVQAAEQRPPRIIEFEGRLIEVPHDATDDEIRSILEAGPRPAQSGPWEKYARQNRTAAEASGEHPEAGPPDLTAPTYIAQRANRGIADILGAPMDLATGATNLGLAGADALAGMFGEDTVFGHDMSERIDPRTQPLGSQWIADAIGNVYERLGGHVVGPDEVSGATRIVGEGARFGAGALAGGGALATGAAQKAASVPSASGRLLQTFTRPYKQSTAPLVGDLAGGAGSGAALQTYRETMPDDAEGPVGEIASAIAGGLAGVGGATAVSRATRAGARAAKGSIAGRGEAKAPMRPDGSRRYSTPEMDQAARSVQAQASNPATAARTISEEAAALRQTTPDSALPTTGAMADDPGLAILEREARSRFPKSFQTRDRATVASAGEQLRRTAPNGSTGDEFTRAATDIDTTRVQSARRALDGAEQRRRGAEISARSDAAEIAPSAGQGTKASEALDSEIVERSLRPMQERKNAAFHAIDPDRQVVRDAAPLIEAADQIEDTLGRLNNPSDVLPVRTIERIRNLSVDNGGDGTITFGELNALRPELSAALTKARNAGDFALADNIQRLQAAVNAETKRLAAEMTPAGQRAAHAQQVYGDEFAPVWNVGPGDEARRFRRDFNVDRDARTTTPPSATAGRFLQRGQPEKAQSLRRVMDSLPDAAAAEREARRFLIADLAESGVIDTGSGQIRPDALKRWRGQWGDVLDTVPGLRGEIDDMVRRVDAHEAKLGAFAQEVRAAEQALDDAVKNKGALGLVLGRDPINAVGAIFRAGDPEKAMAEIVDQLGTNSRARNGLKAAVADYMQSRVTTPALERSADATRPVAFEQLENLFDRHMDTLSAVYDPNEMQTLRQVHRLLKPQRAIKAGGQSGAMYDSERSRQAWRLLEGGLKAKFGVLKGGGILRTIRIFADSLPNNGDAIAEIVHRMHFDPDLAQHLLTRPVKEVGTPRWNAKLNRLVAVAAGARADNQQSESVENWSGAYE